MNRNSAPTHATHDELLVARLYGDDLDERERARALDLLAACEECAALFADFGTIARETAALPVPTRPRDFTLTPADAARLGRPRRSWAALVGFGRVRALGGSLAAVGFAGMALLGTLTMFAPSGPTPTEYGAVAAQNDSGGKSGPYANGTGETAYSQDSTGALPSGSSAEVADFGTWTSPKPPSGTPTGTDQGVRAAESIVPSAAWSGGKSADDTTANGQNVGASGSPPATGTVAPEMAPKPASTSGAGGVRVDPRLIGLAGFAVLAALGLFLMVAVPRLSGRRTHR